MAMQTTFVEIFLFVFLYCLLLNSSVTEELLNHKACLNVFNQSYCKQLYSFNSNNNTNSIVKVNQDLVQKKASRWGVYLSMAGNIPSLFVTLLFGVCSDKIGRKTFILMPVIGYVISNVTFGLIAYYDSIPIYFLYIGSLIGSCFGGFYAVLSSCFAYVADITNEANRTKRIVLLESMTGLGGVIGSLTGGFIVERFGYVYVYMFICILYVLQIIYWFFLKETRHGLTGWKFSINEVIGDHGLKRQIRLLFFHNESGVQRCVITALFTCFLLVFCLFGFPSACIKKQLHEPLNFDSTSVGYFLATSNSCVFVGAVAIDFICFHLLKWKDTTVLLMGGPSLIATLISLGLAQTKLGMFLGLLWLLFIGGTLPSLRSILSKLFDAADQGKVFASIAFIEAVANLLAGVAVSYIYEKTVTISTSFVLYILSGIAFLVVILTIILIMFRVTDKYKKLEKEPFDAYVDDENPTII